MVSLTEEQSVIYVHNLMLLATCHRSISFSLKALQQSCFVALELCLVTANSLVLQQCSAPVFGRFPV
jgi:hypothetical protein